jgi:hypothetical protein
MKALYHMSRTAGVGLGDYAAVNVLSVIGLIVGFSCFLLLIFGDSLLMLALPLAAIITCIVAIVQIRGSNGTQVGITLAIGGLLLAMAFGGINLATRFSVARAQANDRAQIETLVSRLSSAATTQSSVPASYELFHPRFQEKVKPETFTRTIALRTGLLANAPVAKIELGQNVLFEKIPQTQIVQASALMVMLSREMDPTGKPYKIEIPVFFRREGNGEWRFFAIPEWFGKEAEGAAAQG